MRHNKVVTAQGGFIKAGLAVIFFFAVIVGISFWQGHEQLSKQAPSPAPSALISDIKVTANLKSTKPEASKEPSPLPSTSSKPVAAISPTNPPANSSNNEATVYVDTACAQDHDGLGKHIDATITFRNLEKLDSKDLVVSIIDSQTQHRSESHVETNLLNNLSIPAHKYAYAYQGSNVPLELVPDGRDYFVRINKATYNSDGSIKVYVQALETKFGKKCEF